MISNEWGYNHIDAASYYQYGRTRRQPYEKFPVKKAMSTSMYEAVGEDNARFTGFAATSITMKSG